MTEIEQYIASYFGVVDNNDLKTIISYFTLKVVKKGEFILKSSQQCDELCFVQSGILRMFVTLDDKEVTQCISTKGHFSGDLSSFIYDTPSRLTIQALVETELYILTKEDYEKIGKLVPKWNELEKLFLVRFFTILEDRTIRHLSMSAEERYNFFFKNNKELFNQVPLQIIASMLGMRPETLSRIRRKQLL